MTNVLRRLLAGPRMRAGAQASRAPTTAELDPVLFYAILPVALFVRAYWSFPLVFPGGYTRFQGADAWYHMRLVDHLVHNFPLRLTHDPYALFPGGQDVGVAPLLDMVIAAVAFAALAVVAPVARILPRAELQIASLVLLSAWVAILVGLGRSARRVDLPRALFPVAVLGAAALLAGCLYLLSPSTTRSAVEQLGRLAPRGADLTVAEARPLLLGDSTLSLAPAWHQYGAVFFLGLGGLALLALHAARTGAPAESLLVVWSAAMLGATLSQQRFGYYLTLNLCLLTGLLYRSALGSARHAGSRNGRVRARPVLRAAGATCALALAFVSGLGPALATVRTVGGPTRDWHDALLWMRRNTPEPLGDPSAYLARYPRLTPGSRHPLPATAYGVLSWWDYGYWITRIAHRIPIANPTQTGVETAARFFTATDPAAACRTLHDAGARFVVVDRLLGVWPAGTGPLGMLGAMAQWAGDDPKRFCEAFWERSADATVTPTLLYYPAYYRTMAVRLYLGAGQEVTPRHSSWVVCFREHEVPRGGVVKEIVSSQCFATHGEAAAYLAEQSGPGWRLVGRHPLLPCVPLEPLEDLALVYQPTAAAVSFGDRHVPQLRIFELRPAFETGSAGGA